MSVSSTNPVAGPFFGNGVTTSFPFAFSAVDPAEVRVLLRSVTGDTVLSTGVVVTLSGSGGSAVVTPAPPIGVQVYVYSDPSFAQLVQFEDGSRWLAGPVNEANDRAALRDLALRERASRAISFPMGESVSPLPPVAQRLGKVLGFDSVTGAPIASPASAATLGTYLANLATLGGGDGKGYYLGWGGFSAVLKGKAFEYAGGTTASPQQGGGPLARFAQTENITDLAAQMGGNAVDNERNAALLVSTTALDGSLAQANALYATAVGAPDADLCAAVFTARRTDTRFHNAYAFYAETRMDAPLNVAVAAEIRSGNFAGVDANFNPGGQSQSGGFWMSTTGNNNHGPALAVGSAAGTGRWYAGLHGTTGGVLNSVVLSSGNPRVSQAVGAHTMGDDFSAATFSDSAIKLPASGRYQDGVNFGANARLWASSSGILYGTGRLNVGAIGVLNGVFPFTEGYGQLVGQANDGNYGVIGFSRGSDNHNAGSMSTTGVGAFVANDNATQVLTAYALYAEGRRYAGAGTTQASEFNALNGGTTVDCDPYTLFPNYPQGLTIAGWFSAGRTDTTLNNPCSVGVGIVPNGAYFRRGFLVRGGSLDPAGPMEALATYAGTKIAWYSAAATISAAITDKYLMLTEVAASAVPTPPAGSQAVFFDTSDHKIKRKDSGGAVTILA